MNDLLAQYLGTEPAAAVREALRGQHREIEVDTPEWTATGYTEAQLVAVIVQWASGEHRRPQRCIAKLCPKGPHARESEKHAQAWKRSPKSFRAQHLVRLLLAPISCPDGSVVTVQDLAAGSLKRCQPLSALAGDARTAACAIVCQILLNEWTGRDYGKSEPETAARLLRRELGDSFEPDGWLHLWAGSRGLLDPACAWLETERDEVIPNPLSILGPDATSTTVAFQYVTGRCHGDLHGDNILIPQKADGTPEPEAFRLIDLATFEYDAPLSRDVATLLMATVARQAGDLPHGQQDALIRYLVQYDSKALSKLPPELSDVVDAIRDTYDAPFVKRGWSDSWRVQLTVSLLAQALLHSTYDSVGPAGRWWCLRLAGHLARQLLPPDARPGTQPHRLGPELYAESAGSGPSAVPATPQHKHPQPAGPPLFVDRDGECERLRVVLKDDQSAVIIVNGSQGMGKSAVVRMVLDGLVPDATDRPDHKLHRHRVSPESGIDVKTLIDYIEAGAQLENRFANGESSLARLEAAMETVEGPPVVIVVDDAEHLLDHITHRMRDADLDDALERISIQRPPPVKVVLVCAHVPLSANGNTWPRTTEPIHVGGLPYPFFLDCLRNLDPTQRSGLSTLPPDTLADVHRQLQGNPRLAELLHAIITTGDNELPLHKVGHELSARPAKDIPRFLLVELLRGLPEGRRRVLEALAAFAAPVYAAAVIALLGNRLSEARILVALKQLVDVHLVHPTTDDRYYVPTSDAEQILAHLSDNGPDGISRDQQRSALLLRAADVLAGDQTPNSEVHAVGDLRDRFTELSILLRAGEYGPAHELIEYMDVPLRRWNRGDLLLAQREAVRGKLEDDYAEMENYNALGDLYVSRGRFPDAKGAYNNALQYESAFAGRPERTKIFSNMAAMHWESNATAKAREYYHSALAMAQEYDDLEDQIFTLEGLADCDRRWGQYADAIRQAEQALHAAQESSSSRAVNIGLKLARWYAELGRTNDAGRLLEAAEQEAIEHADPALQAACLDGRADLALHKGDVDVAVETARRAVNIAMPQHDPVILLQARTTLCLAHLIEDDVVAAEREIDQALKYRRRGRSLVVLALRALVSHRRHDSVETEKLFGILLAEAQERRRQDTRDFAAWDFEGLAICGGARNGPRAIRLAVDAFQTARAGTPPAPGLVRRLSLLVEQLAHNSRRPDSLRPVLELLNTATISSPSA